MRLEQLTLRGFRNYEALQASFVPGVNLIVGDNAQGKTNLLEAITYLSAGRSFRTRKEQELILFGADFADLEAVVRQKDRQQTIRAVLFSGRKPRQLYVGGVKQKTAAALSGNLTTVLFCPEDLMLLKAGASGRRRLLDLALCQLRPGYEKALTEYGKLLEGKSRILKDREKNPGMLAVLPEYNQRMVQIGALIIAYRARYLEKLAKETEQVHRDFSGGKESLRVLYETVSTVLDPLSPIELLREQMQMHMQAHERAELESGQCLSGPHKDDFTVYLEDRSIKSFGSQGQLRTAAISLKLAQRELIRQDTGEEPVLLLDDVLSELDPGRQDFVLNHIRSGQVLITCCEKEKLTRLGQVMTIRQGRLVEE